MKRPKRPTESKPGRVFKTGSSPTDSTGIDVSYFHQALGGVAARARVRQCRMVAKVNTPSEVQEMCTVAVRGRQGD